MLPKIGNDVLCPTKDNLPKLENRHRSLHFRYLSCERFPAAGISSNGCAAVHIRDSLQKGGKGSPFMHDGCGQDFNRLSTRLECTKQLKRWLIVGRVKVSILLFSVVQNLSQNAISFKSNKEWQEQFSTRATIHSSVYPYPSCN